MNGRQSRNTPSAGREETFHLAREPQGLLIMVQLTEDFQAWKCFCIFTNSKRQCLEHNKTERYNQSKLVFTELVDVSRFIAGRKAKLKFNLWTVAFCTCTDVHSIDPQSMAVSLRNHTGVLEMSFKQRSLCIAKMIIKKSEFEGKVDGKINVGPYPKDKPEDSRESQKEWWL